MVLAVAAIVLAASITGRSPSDDGPEVGVALPDTGDVQDDALSDAEERTLRRDADLERLRCEPRDCELWRRERAAPSAVVAVADLVVVLEGDRLTALDATSGEERWVAPVGQLRSFSRSEGAVRSSSSQAQLHPSPADDGVLLVTRTEVSHIDLVGARSWTQEPEFGSTWDSTVLPDALVLEDQPGRQRPTELVALDPATGEPLWTHFASSVHLLEPDLMMTSGPDRWLRAFDPATGDLVWELGQQAGSWARSFGPWVAQHNDSGIALLDRATGEVVGSLPGYLADDVVAAGDRWIAVITAETARWSVEDPTAYVVVALTADAEVAWQLPLSAPPGFGCCPLLVSDDDGEVAVLGAEGVTAVDVATGRTVDGGWIEERPSAPGGSTDGGEADRGDPIRAERAWQTVDGTIVRSRGPGELVVQTDDRAVVVRGREVHVESLDPLVVGSADHLMGLRTTASPDP